MLTSFWISAGCLSKDAPSFLSGLVWLKSREKHEYYGVSDQKGLCGLFLGWHVCNNACWVLLGLLIFHSFYLRISWREMNLFLVWQLVEDYINMQWLWCGQPCSNGLFLNFPQGSNTNVITGLRKETVKTDVFRWLHLDLFLQRWRIVFIGMGSRKQLYK